LSQRRRGAGDVGGDGWGGGGGDGGGVGGTRVTGGAESAIVETMTRSHFLPAQKHSSRAGSLKRGDVLDIVLQQPSEHLAELVDELSSVSC
jgi:hypothetical protein